MPGDFRSAMPELRAAIEDAEILTAVDLLETAERHSGGGLTARDLAQLDHPFARRHGSPLLDPGEINRRSGRFQAGWTPIPPFREDGGSTVGIYNADEPVASYLQQRQDAEIGDYDEGAGVSRSTMFARPVDVKILEEVAPRHEARIEAALRRVLG